MVSSHQSLVVANNGGIIGRCVQLRTSLIRLLTNVRGVLLDYAEWAASKSIQVRALESTTISLDDIQSIVKEYGIQFRQGDILFIRSGFTTAYNKLDDQQRKDLAHRSSPDFIGVEATEGMLRWLWEHQFSAVAGDAPSFERAPIRGSHANPDFNLHEWILAGWGCPIGEMFDLEALSSHCKAIERYSFFLSSVPLKVSIVLDLLTYANEGILGHWGCRKSAQCGCDLLNCKVVVIPPVARSSNSLWV